MKHHQYIRYKNQLVIELCILFKAFSVPNVNSKINKSHVQKIEHLSTFPHVLRHSPQWLLGWWTAQAQWRSRACCTRHRRVQSVHCRRGWLSAARRLPPGPQRMNATGSSGGSSTRPKGKKRKKVNCQIHRKYFQFITLNFFCSFLYKVKTTYVQCTQTL